MANRGGGGSSKTSENIPCGWTTCQATFGSQLDMGLHVVSHHLDVLDYGHFVLERPVFKQKFNEPAAKKPRISATEELQIPGVIPCRMLPDSPISSPNGTERKLAYTPGITMRRLTPKRRESIKNSSTVPFRMDPVVPVAPVAPVVAPAPVAPVAPVIPVKKAEPPKKVVGIKENITKSESHELSVAACCLMRRIRSIPNDHIFFESPNYCLLCLKNHMIPCKDEEHEEDDLKILKELRRKLGSAHADKRVLLNHLKQMIEEYDEKSMEPNDSPNENLPSSAPSTSTPSTSSMKQMDPDSRKLLRFAFPSLGAAWEAADGDGPSTSGVTLPTPQSYRLRSRNVSIFKEIKQEENEREHEEGGGESRNSDARDNRDSPSLPTTTSPIISMTPPPSTPKMSKLCQALILRLRGRATATFRATDRSQFCLTCLSFNKCDKKIHADEWRRLENAWASINNREDGKISPELLIIQLEEMKKTYLGEEASSNFNNENRVDEN